MAKDYGCYDIIISVLKINDQMKDRIIDQIKIN